MAMGHKVHSAGSLRAPVDTDELLRAVVEFLRVWREQAPSRVSTSGFTMHAGSPTFAMARSVTGRNPWPDMSSCTA